MFPEQIQLSGAEIRVRHTFDRRRPFFGVARPFPRQRLPVLRPLKFLTANLRNLFAQFLIRRLKRSQQFGASGLRLLVSAAKLFLKTAFSGGQFLRQTPRFLRVGSVHIALCLLQFPAETVYLLSIPPLNFPPLALLTVYSRVQIPFHPPNPVAEFVYFRHFDFPPVLRLTEAFHPPRESPFARRR